MRDQYVRREPTKKRNHWYLIPIVLTVIFVGGFLFTRYAFQISKITITGSEHYSYEELYEYIFANRNDKNLLMFWYEDGQNPPIEIPFIAKVDVELHWPNAIDVTVYEKSIIGYVTYMGSYMYFDKDGIVVESTKEPILNVPYVSGLDFTDIVINQPLDVGDDSIFSQIQNLNQYLEKYAIVVDEIMISKDMTFAIQMDQVKVLLGNEQTSFSEKIYELSCMHGKLEGLSGTLDMQKYNGDSSYITFASDEETPTQMETQTDLAETAMDENPEENTLE